MSNKNNVTLCFMITFFFLSFSVLCFGDEITIDNWKYHQSIKEVRTIYKDIKNGVKNSKYKLKEYRGDRDCGEFICFVYQFEITDQNGLIRACGMTDFTSPDQIEHIREEYFDDSGVLRFRLQLFKYYSLDVVLKEKIRRLYQDKNGKQIWWIEMLDGKVTEYEPEEENPPSHVYKSTQCRRFKWGK